MKVAITGTHFSGKTTVISELMRHLPDYHFMPEPYYQLAEEGYAFYAMPTREDFEAQLARSIANLSGCEPNTLFDRCPLDFLAYLACHRDRAGFVLDGCLPEVLTALKKLDLIVYLPIEVPDRIELPASQDEDLRAAVDDKLRELLFDDTCNLTQKTLEIQGPLASRVAQILTRINQTNG